MKKRLTSDETLAVAVMLFGMFFGAGNLIFPVHLGQLSGSNVLWAAAGFIVTGVSIPVLGVACLGAAHKESLEELAGNVGKKYSVFFTTLLCLTIGPFFAIPRCATTPFSIGIEPLAGERAGLALTLWSVVFFALVLFFSLKPSGFVTWVGKILTPAFLIVLAVLLAAAFIKPLGGVFGVLPDPSYAEAGMAFSKGFLEGYNTMDAIASLAFGIVVINAIKGFGLKDDRDIARAAVKSGIICGLIMAVLYIFICLMGTFSLGKFTVSENGGIALGQISGHYFGIFGSLLLTAIAGLACLKTAISLVTSISAGFSKMFKKGLSYNGWAIAITLFSFAVSNFGLTAIINSAVPVLMFLYPLAITLILLALFGRFFGHDRKVYVSVTAFTFAAALLDLLNALPAGAKAALHAEPLLEGAKSALPFFGAGLGWVVPAAVGLVLGLILHGTAKKAEKAS